MGWLEVIGFHQYRLCFAHHAIDGQLLLGKVTRRRRRCYMWIDARPCFFLSNICVCLHFFHHGEESTAGLEMEIMKSELRISSMGHRYQLHSHIQALRGREQARRQSQHQLNIVDNDHLMQEMEDHQLLAKQVQVQSIYH